MFDEILKEVKKISGQHEFPIPVEVDDDGYFDRLCPSQECSGAFKVLFEDWTGKVSDTRAFCPFCRHEASGVEWNTPEQEKYIETATLAAAARIYGDAIKRGVDRTRPVRIGGGLLQFSMGLSYRPGRIPTAIPPKATDELRQKFACEECGCRYSSLGASFFCPACGHNSALSSFDQTIEAVRKSVLVINAFRGAMEKEVNADAAADAVRHILEDQYSRLVGAFERINEALFDKLPIASQSAKPRGVFQRLDDGSDLWRQATGKGYSDFLTVDELVRLKLLFQRRHVLGHRQGIVDQSYIDRSGDTRYAVGQRLVVRDKEVLEFADLVSKLVSALRGLV